MDTDRGRLNMKTIIKQTGLAPYLRPIYRKLIRSPYWRARQIVRRPISKEVAGVRASFWPAIHMSNNHELNSEEKYITKIIENIGEGDVFYDIGANIGIYSYFLANSGANVFAFEPSPRPFEYLTKNAEFNEPISANQIAISDIDGEVEFLVDESDVFGRMSSLNSSSDDVIYNKIQVESRRLDSLVLESDFPKPDLLKIDVEGAEADVLAGLSRLPTLPRSIFCEIHYHRLSEFSSSGEEIYDVLRDSGYQIDVIQERNNSEFIKASLP